MAAWNVNGKIAIVTGASAGIGLETARALAAKGATVWIVVRNESKGRAAMDEIRKTVPDAKLELELADFASKKSIRECAARLREKLPALHVLVNNAGAINMERQLSVDGLELTFAVNHLGYFLFTQELLPLLKKSAPARVVNVSSQAHMGVRIDFEDLQSEKSFHGFRVYQRSKLANLYFTYELAERLKGTGVTVNAAHPGMVGSSFGQNNQGLLKFFYDIAGPLMRSSEKGARTSVHLAVAPELEGVSGKYFQNSRETKSSGVSYKEDARKRLWELSEALVAR